MVVRCAVLITQLTSHLLSSEHSCGLLVVTDRSNSSVRFGVTVTHVLTRKVPSLHCASISLSFGDSLDVHEMTYLVVSWPEHVANWKEVLWTHLEFVYVFLWRHSCFEAVANKGLLQLFRIVDLARAKLNGIATVLLLRLHLQHLASINLDNRHGVLLAPLVPKTGHADLVPQ